MLCTWHGLVLSRLRDDVGAAIRNASWPDLCELSYNHAGRSHELVTIAPQELMIEAVRAATVEERHKLSCEVSCRNRQHLTRKQQAVENLIVRRVCVLRDWRKFATRIGESLQAR